MHRHNIRPRLRKSGNERVWRLNHQMHVQDAARFVRQRAQRRHCQRSHGEIGHKMPIHHIHVQPIYPRRDSLAAVRPQPRKIRRQNRRSQPDFSHPPPSPSSVICFLLPVICCLFSIACFATAAAVNPNCSYNVS